MDRKMHWDTVYRSKAAYEVSWFQPRPEASLQLIARAGAGLEGAVIDVGGGASLLVDVLLDEGYGDVSVLDISAEAIGATRQRLGDRAAQVHWLLEDVTRFEPPRQYAVWHDRAVFHFLTNPADRAAYVRAAMEGVMPGGSLIVAAFAPHGPEQCSGLPVVRYSASELESQFAEGFEGVERLEEVHVTPFGGQQPFVYCRLRRR